MSNTKKETLKTAGEKRKAEGSVGTQVVKRPRTQTLFKNMIDSPFHFTWSLFSSLLLNINEHTHFFQKKKQKIKKKKGGERPWSCSGEKIVN